MLYNPKCSKCRTALEIAETSGAQVEVIEYLKTPPTEAELDALLKQLGLEPEAIVRKGEDLYAELGLEQKPPSSRAAWIKLLVKNPILIERPIVSDGKLAVVARPAENIKKLLK